MIFDIRGGILSQAGVIDYWRSVQSTTRYFAPLSLALDVIAEPDSIHDQQLVLFVVVHLTPAEAFAKLQRFDNEWWLDAMDDARGCLCISLEFR